MKMNSEVNIRRCEEAIRRVGLSAPLIAGRERYHDAESDSVRTAEIELELFYCRVQRIQ